MAVLQPSIVSQRLPISTYTVTNTSHKAANCPSRISTMSSDPLMRQVPINGTRQKIVPSGSQSNLYYIVLSNLPWQTSWQQLKDHVRSVCSVERVEVFSESTAGWVMVRGRDNYEAAFNLLEGGIFNGRALFADGRNATEPIMIKELVDPSDYPGSNQRSPRTPRHSTPHSSQAPASPPMSSPVNTEYSHWPATPSSMSYMVSPTTDYSSRSASIASSYGVPSQRYTYETTCSYVDHSGMMPINMAQSSYEPAYTGAYHYPADESQAYTWSYDLPLENTTNDLPPAGVSTKKRKIIIKQLRPQASEDQIQHHISKYMGESYAEQLEYLNIPMAEGNESTRGYAIAIFKTEEAASRAVRKLNGVKLDGRKLDVYVTKEGVSEKEVTSSSSRSHRSHREEKREKKEKESSSDKKSKSQSHKSTVVIANGTTSSTSRRHDDKDKKSSRKH